MAHTARTLTMIANVRADFNDLSQKFVTDDMLVGHFNRAQKIIARKLKYWRKEGLITSVIGQESYNLLTSLSDFVDLHSVRWHDDDDKMDPCNTKEEFDQEKVEGEYSASLDTPSVWLMESNLLYVYPTPTTATVGAFVCWYSYLPPAISSASSGTGPSIPEAYDPLLEAYALIKIHRRRFADKASLPDVQYWMAQFAEDLSDLAQQQKNPNPSLYPDW